MNPSQDTIPSQVQPLTKLQLELEPAEVDVLKLFFDDALTVIKVEEVAGQIPPNMQEVNDLIKLASKFGFTYRWEDIQMPNL